MKRLQKFTKNPREILGLFLLLLATVSLTAAKSIVEYFAELRGEAPGLTWIYIIFLLVLGSLLTLVVISYIKYKRELKAYRKYIIITTIMLVFLIALAI